METSGQTIVIIGANLTGGAAASTLRSEGFHGPLILVGAEPHLPYERPPLSKEYLRGEGPGAIALLHPEDWYRDNDVELILGVRAARIDPAGKAVSLPGGEILRYDSLLVATGGENRRLSVPGHDLEGIFYLRTIEDSDEIRLAALAGRKAVVVGAGFIGSEVTASLRGMGIDVEVVDVLRLPLERVVGPAVGAVWDEIHRDHGVRFHFGQAVERFEGTRRVEAVVTTTGTRIECDFVVVGIGIQPATTILEESVVTVENGVVVNEFCMTNAEGVFAAGDVANHYHPVFGRRLRVEHWDNALKQGAAAAKNMLGQGIVFDDPHWFWSDQYEHNFQFVGIADESDEFIVRGSTRERSFVAFYLRGGVVRAAAAMDRGKELRRASALIRGGNHVDARDLADESVDLRKLASSSK